MTMDGEDTISIRGGDEPARTRPERVGPYRLLETLGEGGMGVVYLAEQEAPVRRRVAVKLIKPGMDSREVIARFQTERQALALMSHPNIARVLDAGATDHGYPYFVMELVKGVRITQYLDKKNLPTRDRLRLFLQICHGVQHAHQKGIIHRDLKPSNILVSLQEQEVVPKIIDFGLAKAMGQSLTDNTLFTGRGLFVGTPAYMSPEQADESGIDVDTRSDIYSLGVLLFEILVGCLPFDFRDSLKKAAYQEIRHAICEVNPPKPSTRISTMGAAAAELARCRSTDPAGLSRRLRGDLDWIVMRAMEKDRSRRYQTVSELIQDIEAHLASRPVSAGPPSIAYRTSKFVSRNRVVVVTGTLVLLSILAGLVGTALGWKKALAEQEVAQQALEQARIARADADLARVDAEKSRDLARESEQKVLARNRQLRVRSAITELPALMREAEDKLWPVAPASCLRMQAWLEDATALVSGRPEYERYLEELRAQGELRRDAVGSMAWAFDSIQDRRLHDQLVELMDGFAIFAGSDPIPGTIARIRERLSLAEGMTTIQERHEKEWRNAIAEIRDPAICPLYHGLEIEPQLGLLPLGRDPESGLHEFTHLASGDPPRRDDDGDLLFDEKSAMVLVLIPGGPFPMGAEPPSPDRPEGSPNVDVNATSIEGPVHDVTLEPYFIGKYEITQLQWKRITGTNPSRHSVATFDPSWARDVQRLNLDLLPVERVSWDDSQRWLPRVGLRLPREAEWEKAARGGTTSVWWTGDTPTTLRRAANIADGSRVGHDTTLREGAYDPEINDGFVVSAPISSFLENPYGLGDVAGNVSEWCDDLLVPYALKLPREELARVVNRVHRGGSWYTPSSTASSAKRQGTGPDTVNEEIGVRAARSLDQPRKTR